MLLGQVEVEKCFMDLDQQEQLDRLNGDMKPGLKLEYTFDMEDEMADSSEGNAGILCNRGGRNNETACDIMPEKRKRCRRAGRIRRQVPFLAVCSTGNLPWSRKRK